MNTTTTTSAVIAGVDFTVTTVKDGRTIVSKKLVAANGDSIERDFFGTRTVWFFNPNRKFGEGLFHGSAYYGTLTDAAEKVAARIAAFGTAETIEDLTEALETARRGRSTLHHNHSDAEFNTLVACIDAAEVKATRIAKALNLELITDGGCLLLAVRLDEASSLLDDEAVKLAAEKAEYVAWLDETYPYRGKNWYVKVDGSQATLCETETEDTCEAWGTGSTVWQYVAAEHAVLLVLLAQVLDTLDDETTAALVQVMLCVINPDELPDLTEQALACFLNMPLHHLPVMLELAGQAGSDWHGSFESLCEAPSLLFR